MMEQEWNLERLISTGLQIEFQDHATIEHWLHRTYVALAPFPEQQRTLELACSEWASPEEKIQQGLEILNEVLDHLKERRGNYDVVPNREGARSENIRRPEPVIVFRTPRRGSK